MIRKQDILDRAGEWGLRPDVVEKDYVLGWLLAGFAANGLAARSWVFKGGTCLKKCFFETYRFSEDLDFSLTPDAAYDDASVRSIITEVAGYAAEMSGINFPADRIELKARPDKLGRSTYQGKVAYQGPLVMPNWPRLLLDITQHEAIVDTPRRRFIFHLTQTSFHTVPRHFVIRWRSYSPRRRARSSNGLARAISTMSCIYGTVAGSSRWSRLAMSSDRSV